MSTTFISATGVTILLGLIAVVFGLGCLIIGWLDDLRWWRDRTQPRRNHRAAASALSSGRVLKAMAAAVAALRTALTTASNGTRP